MSVQTYYEIKETLLTKEVFQGYTKGTPVWVQFTD